MLPIIEYEILWQSSKAKLPILVTQSPISTDTRLLPVTSLSVIADVESHSADDVVPPLPAAACEHDQVNLLRYIGVQHLLQIIGSHSAVGLKVRTAHVYHDGYCVFAVAQHFHELVSGFR